MFPLTLQSIYDKFIIILSQERRITKKKIYTWIKIGGILSFIPFVLVSGPIAGFFLGNFLQKKFGWPLSVTLILVTIGFIGSVRETIRIIKIALKSEG